MTEAYATFASRGIHHAAEPIASVRVAGGKTLYTFEPQGRRVVAQNIVDQAVEAMQGVVQYGTGVGANIGRPVAGQDRHDGVARRTPGSAASRRSS